MYTNEYFNQTFKADYCCCLLPLSRRTLMAGDLTAAICEMGEPVLTGRLMFAELLISLLPICKTSRDECGLQFLTITDCGHAHTLHLGTCETQYPLQTGFVVKPCVFTVPCLLAEYTLCLLIVTEYTVRE